MSFIHPRSRSCFDGFPPGSAQSFIANLSLTASITTWLTFLRTPQHFEVEKLEPQQFEVEKFEVEKPFKESLENGHP
jgi:hypothetical protein